MAEIDATRADLSSQVETARKDLLGKADAQLSTIQSESFRQITEFRSMADRRIGDTLDRADAALGKVEELRGDLKPALDHAGSVAKQVDDASPLFLDCEFNPDCLFNRYVGASKGIERAALSFGQMSTDERAPIQSGSLAQFPGAW